MVEIILAGYNVDREALKELVNKGKVAQQDLNNLLTPETISAAYARISRDPRSVTELREVARKEVEKARKSNKAIVFKMGHHSVAEHVVLNFDVLGISRLAIEFLEAQRLCSYTEKSQRYITMEGDYVMPEELLKFEKEVRGLVDLENNTYLEFYPVLRDYFINDEGFVDLAHQVITAEEEQQGKMFVDKMRAKKLEGILDGWAKEDARYVLCLATESQLGFTSNARDLEKFIKYCAVYPLKELRDLGKKLCDVGMKIIPSLLLFTEPGDYFKKSKQRANKHILEKIIRSDSPVDLTTRIHTIGDGVVRMINPDMDADNKLIAALIQRATNDSFHACYNRAFDLSSDQKTELIKKTLEDIRQWDAVPREFEIPDSTFEVVMSASAFAQFKRHRILTLLPQPYDPERLGYTIPPSITNSGLEGKFKEIMRKSKELYHKVKGHESFAAPYVLTNAHNRRVLVKMNARELYHFSRFREDLHAQWDIRRKAKQMVRLAKKVMPLTTMLLGGKHEFQKIYNKAYAK